MKAQTPRVERAPKELRCFPATAHRFHAHIYWGDYLIVDTSDTALNDPQEYLIDSSGHNHGRIVLTYDEGSL